MMEGMETVERNNLRARDLRTGNAFLGSIGWPVQVKDAERNGSWLDGNHGGVVESLGMRVFVFERAG